MGPVPESLSHGGSILMGKIKGIFLSIALLIMILLALQPAQAKYLQNPSAISSNIIPAASQFCHGHKSVTGRTGIASKQSKAKERARRKWRERVRWLMPWSWGQADWGKAKERSYSCKKKHGTWRCKASGIPCAGWPKR